MNRRILLSAFLFVVFVTGNAAAQRRERVVPKTPQQQKQQPPVARNEPKSEPQDLREDYARPARPTLTNNIVVVKTYQPLVKKTVSSQPTNAAAASALAVNSSSSAGRYSYNQMFSMRLLGAIQSRLGKPYRYGSSGPNAYDCSGLVWSVFTEAGFPFDRTSARSIWEMSEPVEGDARFKMGTLIFFNNLKHIGIVADENGFFEASTSRGVIYSRFDGYWKDKIVGFRRLKIENQTAQK